MTEQSEGPIRLWLDDQRDPVLHGRMGWTWAKNYGEAVRLLRTGRVKCASLDHDLTPLRSIGMDDGSDTGYDVLVWMIRHQVVPPGGVEVHSQNPEGRRRMEILVRQLYRGRPQPGR